MVQPIIDINDERSVRLGKLASLYEANIDPYPRTVTRTHTLAEAREAAIDTTMSVVGRILVKRDIGKIMFLQLIDGSTETLQAVVKKDTLGAESYAMLSKKIDAGDIVAVHGERFDTNTGERSILVSSWNILAKSLLPLPDKFHGLQDDELRLRKRYLDFLLHKEARTKIEVRSKLIRAIRLVLEREGFLEVETPILETVASGAMAKTFDTHIYAYDMDVHLRICMGELWQKKLLVGGFEKTFEIGRAFRNEGVDHQHNPEFTMLEFYWAYADYEQNMALHERLIPEVVEAAIGTRSVTHEGQTIDFTAPYPRITFRDAVLQYSGIDINEYDDTEALKKVMKTKGYEVETDATRGPLLDSLYKQSARPKLIQPTFVLNYPVELKPLAKKAADHRYTEMFQLIVSGFELSNSYTELNDPVDQRERFEEQAKNKAAGDDEAMAYDADYIEALEHGMPPATGTGIGIDRFAALITGSHTLREVTTFPLVKPRTQPTIDTLIT